MNRKNVAFTFKLLVVLALFVLIFRPETFGFSGLFGDVKPQDVWRALREAGSTGPAAFVFWMACATAVKLLGIGSGILRWHLLLVGQGLKIPFVYLAYQWFMGRAIGLLLPGTLGLDGYRLVESSRYTREVVKCATVIAVEKLTGIIALSFLVFITFPLGFKFFQFNPVLLAGFMCCLLVGVVCSLLLLLNPRLIQVLIAVVPAPPLVRGLVNKLGRAATAYGNARGTLMAALFFGVLVHLGTCSKYFFTFMAIRATNVSVTDIFFVSPLMITASVLAFTISGLGVREVAFGLVLGGSTGHAVAILGGHLGLWAGEIVPFALSVPLLLFGGRPSRENLEQDSRYVSDHLSGEDYALQPLLSREETRRYRREVAALLACGAAVGLLAGALIACVESIWIIMHLPALQDWSLIAWGTLTYGVIFAGIGIGVAGGLLFLSLLFDRFPGWPATVALCYAATLSIGGLVIGLFRYQRDALAGHAMTSREYAVLFAFVCGGSLLLGVIAYLKAEAFKRYIRDSVPWFTSACVSGWMFMYVVVALIAYLFAPRPEIIVFHPEAQHEGPNILLCTVDALRADYLRAYASGAEAHTPNLDSFVDDSILFLNAFSQASWTKPSYGTLFTGLYPEAHGATTKTAMLSSSVETVAELLSEGGYFTQGFSNNPNMTRLFGMNRGFVDYMDLKPDPLFGAPASAMHLSLYGVMRKVFMVAEGRLRGGRLRVTDFYQPAEVITRTALDWLDAGRYGEAPFYLYLHYMDTHDPFMEHDNPGVGYARARMENPDPERWLEPMRNAYISEIEYMDNYWGALFDGLKERGLYDNTVIVFLSDHGEEFFDHQGWWHGQTLYEEQLRVPLIVKLPNNDMGGTLNTDIARLIDVPPTLLHLAGMEAGAAMSGQPLYDVSGVFTNAGIAFSYAENDFEGNWQQAVRTLEHALLRANSDNPRGVEPLELYDMKEDPQQQRNLATSEGHTSTLEHLAEVIEQYQRMILENAPEPAGQADMDPLLRQQLEALGYL